jgi:hypothetical protein
MTVKLNYAKIETVNALIDKGLERNVAERLVQQFSSQEHENVYSVKEIDKMMADTVREVFTETRREFDKRMEATEKRMEVTEKRIEDEIKEMRSHKRWIVGTIITVGLAVIGYLQFMH